MWYIKWKINMSVVWNITVSWTSSAVAKKGYYLLKCLAMLILSDWCRFYDNMIYESDIYLYVAWFIRHCGLGLIIFWPRPHRKFLASASASHFLTSASVSSFSGLINKPAHICGLFIECQHTLYSVHIQVILCCTNMIVFPMVIITLQKLILDYT